eukprot:2685162-Alexandrium_andersonii.AAC.1
MLSPRAALGGVLLCVALVPGVAVEMEHLVALVRAVRVGFPLKSAGSWWCCLFPGASRRDVLPRFDLA